MWTAALRTHDVSRLQDLTQRLTSFLPNVVPPVAPPPLSQEQRVAVQAAHAPPSTQRVANIPAAVLGRYSVLMINDDVNDAPPPLEVDPASPGTDPQTRYLLAQARCHLAELYREQSAECMSGSEPGKWTQAAEHLKTAFSILDQLMNTDEYYCRWWAALVANEEAPLESPLGDGHDLAYLTQLRDSLNVEHSTLSERHIRAQQAVERRREWVERKLNPLENDRQMVRSQMGEQRWRSNPAPKMTYAERIAALQAELADLEQAQQLLVSLQLQPLPRGVRRARGGNARAH
jgi:hypothetical protein